MTTTLPIILDDNAEAYSWLWEISYIEDGEPRVEHHRIPCESVINLYKQLHDEPGLSDLRFRRAYKPIYSDQSNGGYCDATETLENWIYE